jgi:hypothetical protein
MQERREEQHEVGLNLNIPSRHRLKFSISKEQKQLHIEAAPVSLPMAMSSKMP